MTVIFRTLIGQANYRKWIQGYVYVDGLPVLELLAFAMSYATPQLSFDHNGDPSCNRRELWEDQGRNVKLQRSTTKAVYISMCFSRLIMPATEFVKTNIPSPAHCPGNPVSQQQSR